MNDFWEKIENLYKEKYKNTEDYKVESPSLKRILEKIRDKLKDQYEFIEPIGMGGAGIVIHVKDKKLNLDRALKIPRPKKEINSLIDSFRSEIEHLNNVRHKNIINVYTFDEVNIEGFDFSYPYFIMDYIEGAKDLIKRISDILDDVITKDTKGKDTEEIIKEIMEFVVDKFYKIAEAIKYLHEKHKIIHFDIKPSNILIDKNDEPILTDLGFARRKSDDETLQTVGFAYFYAHPDLKTVYSYMSSKDRVRKKVTSKDFKYLWDIYAFGKSLLEILSLIDQAFPNRTVYDYFFVYTHLAACRMLDGRNLSGNQTERIIEEQKKKGEKISVYKETWLGLDARDFKGIKYKTFEEICKDFEKLLQGEAYLNESIPELSISYPKRIQSSEGTPAPFSKRVKYIVEHPVFSRLMYVPQLSLLNYVYPTATHNRLEHSVGTFRNCCLYVQSLWNDPYNPLFKQLVDEKDIKCVLIASLLHDLGQYPLAHAIGENVRELRHENFTLLFLDNPTKDKFGHTLQEIIENREWGWGVPLKCIKEILKGREKPRGLFANIKSKMLSSIIDGPIDVDKLDYLLRDSHNCYLKYGDIIDVDRLIKNLTVIITKDKNITDITIGTYEKGQSAAESIGFARYLLYQSVYWHHTARAIRAMLKEAIKPALGKGKRGRYSTFYDELKELLGVTKEPRNIIVNDILNLIEKRTDKEGKEMIKLIRQRNYYKRILTIHSYPSIGKGKESLLERFRKNYKKLNFEETLQKEILGMFLQFSKKYPKVSSLAPEKTNKTEEMLSTPHKKIIICDCPTPTYGTDEMLRFIPQPQRLQQNYSKRTETGERISEVWTEAYFKLMNITSKGRVFCHPDVRDTLMAALSPNDIKGCVEKAIQKNYL